MAKDLRLQVALAQLGYSSRRRAAQIIRAGRVKVNGKLAVTPGQRVSLGQDFITVDGQSSCLPPKTYLILNKPKGVVVSVKDRFAGRTVLDLIPNCQQRIYPVGRLDKDTTGLLLLTNDGQLAYRLTHPKFGVPKVYQVKVRGKLCAKNIKRLEAGIFIEGKKTYPCKIQMISGNRQSSRLRIELSEGRKRQIKKMFAALGHPVLAIERVSFGPLRLTNLKAGKWRPLSRLELSRLTKAAGVN